MKLFICDLHGTLEYGNHRAVVDISNRVLTDYGHRERLSYADGHRLYGLKWFEYFTWLLGPESLDEALALQDACFKVSESDLDFQCRWIAPTPHAESVLHQIAQEHDQLLISNTRTSTLDVFLKMLKFERFFPPGRAFAVDQHTHDVARTKADVLAAFLDQGHPYEQIIIVGDSPGDIHLKAVSGGLACLFSHPEFEFRQCTPDIRIRDLRDLLQFV